MRQRFTPMFSIAAVFVASAMLSFLSCSNNDGPTGPSLNGERDSLPTLKSVGVSTLISDSGIIRYKLIAEDWYIYDKKNPTYWSFEKGLFVEKFNESYQVDAFISCDTAYYYDQQRLWELRGRVLVKNMKGETFRTTLLYWDQQAHRFYSDHYMEIEGETTQLAGYDFSSNEQMTDYIIHSSKGLFPIEDNEPTPQPDPVIMAEQEQESAKNEEEGIKIKN